MKENLVLAGGEKILPTALCTQGMKGPWAIGFTSSVWKIKHRLSLSYFSFLACLKACHSVIRNISFHLRMCEQNIFAEINLRYFPIISNCNKTIKLGLL